MLERNGKHTRGIVVLVLDAPEDEFASFALASRFPLVNGFAVGRTIFGQAARESLAARVDDAQAMMRWL